jgi:CheY-like chemotaxis protein
MQSDPKHILMADDDPDDIEMFQSAVDETCSALQLTVATDGEKFLALLSKSPKPYAIFLDLNMPIITGKECLLEIRTKNEYDDVPIVIFSTSAQKSEIDFCLKNGANNYLTKPSSYAGIKSIVDNLCNESLITAETFKKDKDNSTVGSV